ncbi:purine-nucleoside phosphorylase [Anaerolineales bacterium HSG6]|nr:purine-nucleoside phosphorylase [Anaerolineales bacterium HSG6]MDM8531204.1 purine-nucleoside phosphorylase [Anaerolineales bacterium HSG25]
MSVTTKPFFSYEKITATADYIRQQTSHQPKIGLILGSGLSPLAEEIEPADYVPYDDIPNFPVSGVVGHAGRLVIGELAGKTVLVMQGRSHFYEGYSMQHITLPVRAMKLLGIETLVVTNAAGGINSNFTAGDLMLINDHINMVGFGGSNPLSGPNLAEFGPRFPSMTRAYDRDLKALARRVATEQDITIQEGVYMSLGGPTFETPAEIRFFETIGVDAVGMSTVPEVIVANHAGMRVLGISSITNVAIRNPDSDEETTHQEVLDTGKIIVPKLIKLLKGILTEI